VAAALNHLRRLVASVMLVAMASFVLHGAAMAGFYSHEAGSADCQPVAAQAHQAQGHDHGDGVFHVHAAEPTPDVSHHTEGGHAGHHADGGSDGPCCSSVCSVTLAMSGSDLVSAPMAFANAFQPQSQVGSGIDQGGLKRPPRTPSIA
jgi:hypothetical protein